MNVPSAIEEEKSHKKSPSKPKNISRTNELGLKPYKKSCEKSCEKEKQKAQLGYVRIANIVDMEGDQV